MHPPAAVVLGLQQLSPDGFSDAVSILQQSQQRAVSSARGAHD